MGWWRDAKFGMFIHWGIYSVPAGRYGQQDNYGEWIMLQAKIPVAEYGKYAEKFNPVKFNAEEWVALAKAAGQKYIIITSKHHDGFAMYHSAVSAYNIYDATPFKRDPLAELSEACRKEGIQLGFYYSQTQDWHHPGGGACNGNWDKAQDGNFASYIDEIAVSQVKELLSNYGEFPSVLWFDTPQFGMTPDLAAKFFPLMESRPRMIVNDRLGGGFKGDTETPEQVVPATGFPGRDWETCMTMNDHWGYCAGDPNWKSTKDLVRILVDTASKGGNFLLNVGPTSEGLIPQPCVDRLHEMGAWLEKNGDAIYGTTASPFANLSWGRCTRKGDTFYLHVFDWPKDRVLHVPLQNEVRKGYLLAEPGRKLTLDSQGKGLMINLPNQAPDAIDSVVVLEIEGEPVVVSSLAPDTPATRAALVMDKAGPLEADLSK